MSHTTHSICCELLRCGYLDLGTMENLMEEYNFLLPYDVIEETRGRFGEINNINQIIDTIYSLAVSEFLDDEKLDLEEGEDYEIDTNYMASSLSFVKDNIQEKFDDWVSSK